MNSNKTNTLLIFLILSFMSLNSPKISAQPQETLLPVGVSIGETFTYDVLYSEVPLNRQRFLDFGGSTPVFLDTDQFTLTIDNITDSTVCTVINNNSLCENYGPAFETTVSFGSQTYSGVKIHITALAIGLIVSTDWSHTLENMNVSFSTNYFDFYNLSTNTWLTNDSTFVSTIGHYQLNETTLGSQLNNSGQTILIYSDSIYDTARGVMSYAKTNMTITYPNGTTQLDYNVEFKNAAYQGKTDIPPLTDITTSLTSSHESLSSLTQSNTGPELPLPFPVLGVVLSIAVLTMYKSKRVR